MKTVIVYASKKGFLKEVAEKIRTGLDGNADLVDLFREKAKNLASYDVVVMASSVRAGRFSGKFRKFCESQIPLLKEKKIILLIGGLDEEGVAATAARNLSEECRKSLWKTVYAGGRYLPEQHNPLIRSMMEKITKERGAVYHERKDSIDSLIEEIRAVC